MNIVHTPGFLPNRTAYDTYVREVDDSDDGTFEYVITDLAPGNVSNRLRILMYSCLVAGDKDKDFSKHHRLFFLDEAGHWTRGSITCRVSLG